MAIWRGLKSFGARDFSPENSSDEGLKSLAPTKTAADILQFVGYVCFSRVAFFVVRKELEKVK